MRRGAGAARARGATLGSLVTLVVALALAGPAAAVAPPSQDPFWRYDGATPLADIAPGTVLKTRTLPYHVVGIPVPVTAVQLLYRTTGQRGQPITNVTSVLLPPVRAKQRRLVSYQSFYDSLNPADSPSYAIAGGLTFGGLLANVEAGLIAPWLQQGYTVAVPDTEGPTADFAAGPEYGMTTLDGLRAAVNAPRTGVRPATAVGLLGYSGGAIATGWASELAPSYAPDVNRRLVGAAMGGVLVAPAHNLRYVDGSSIWAGVIPMAIVGVARAFDIDLQPYLSAKGASLYRRLQRATIAEVLGVYSGLTWKQLAKPAYATPEDVPIYVTTVNQLIMGRRGTPTTPLFIGQGAAGEKEGTRGDRPGIGRGDGVMIAGDVRSLARQWCAAGTTIQYREYRGDSHTTAIARWVPHAYGWLRNRFFGRPAPANCADIAPGNSLAPIPEEGS